MIILLLMLTATAMVISYLTLAIWDAEALGFTSAAIAVSAGIALIVCGIISIFIYSSANATLVKYQVERESLVYQFENNLYDNDNDLGKKELYDQITEYNRDVVAGRELHYNFLTKCFYPDIYDDLELIELEMGN